MPTRKHLASVFSITRGGEPGQHYHPGERYPVQFFPSGKPTPQVDNYYWPKEMYLSLLSTAGFAQIESIEPTLQDLREEEVAPLAPVAGSLQILTEWDTPPISCCERSRPCRDVTPARHQSFSTEKEPLRGKDHYDFYLAIPSCPCG